MGARFDADGSRRDLSRGRYRLPVSGRSVQIRSATGAEDLLLQRTGISDAALAVELIARLVRLEDGSDCSAADLPVGDSEALLLVLRTMALGDMVQSEVRCTAAQCGARVDISFRISDYLNSLKLRRPRELVRGEDGEWFGLSGVELHFRLPTCADLVAIEHEGSPYDALVRRCIRPARLPGRLRRRVEQAMKRMAPRLSNTMLACCPECQGSFPVHFDVFSFVLRELRDNAASIYQEVHLLALHYHWPEHAILKLPRSRRARYVELLREEGAVSR